jgi:AraC-like DNA-binding protein
MTLQRKLALADLRGAGSASSASALRAASRKRLYCEIACDLTFLDSSYFARFFRRHTGTTPQAFRKGGDVPPDVYL